jgi:hypothetical protein
MLPIRLFVTTMHLPMAVRAKGDIIINEVITITRQPSYMIRLKIGLCIGRQERCWLCAQVTVTFSQYFNKPLKL